MKIFIFGDDSNFSTESLTTKLNDIILKAIEKEEVFVYFSNKYDFGDFIHDYLLIVSKLSHKVKISLLYNFPNQNYFYIEEHPRAKIVKDCDMIISHINKDLFTEEKRLFDYANKIQKAIINI